MAEKRLYVQLEKIQLLDLFTVYANIAENNINRILSMKPTMPGSDVKLTDDPKQFPLAYGITGTGELRRFCARMLDLHKEEGISKVIELVDDVNYGIQSDGWTIVVLHKAAVAKRKIFFNLNNMIDIEGMLRGVGKWGNSLTAREIRYIRDHWAVFNEIITFWKNDVHVPPPWEKPKFPPIEE
jgi:hypothetical protein